MDSREILKIIDAVINVSSAIPDYVVAAYKTAIVNSVNEIETTALSISEDEEVLRAKITEFLQGFKSFSDFGVVNVPIILPVEYIAMLYLFKTLGIFTIVSSTDIFIRSLFEGLKALIGPTSPSHDLDDDRIIN